MRDCKQRSADGGVPTEDCLRRIAYEGLPTKDCLRRIERCWRLVRRAVAEDASTSIQHVVYMAQLYTSHAHGMQTPKTRGVEVSPSWPPLHLVLKMRAMHMYACVHSRRVACRSSFGIIIVIGIMLRMAQTNAVQTAVLCIRTCGCKHCCMALCRLTLHSNNMQQTYRSDNR